MFSVNGKDITISKGDYSIFTITFKGDGKPEEGSPVLFTVKRSTNVSTPMIEKVLTVLDDRVVVILTNSDTKDMYVGAYVWDVRLPNYSGENEPWTPMYAGRFEVKGVVGNV